MVSFSGQTVGSKKVTKINLINTKNNEEVLKMNYNLKQYTYDEPNYSNIDTAVKDNFFTGAKMNDSNRKITSIFSNTNYDSNTNLISKGSAPTVEKKEEKIEKKKSSSKKKKKKGLVSKICGGTKKVVKKACDTGTKAYNKVKNTVSDVVDDIADTGSKVVTSAKSKFNDIVDDVKNSKVVKNAKSVISDIGEGIETAGAKITHAACEFAELWCDGAEQIGTWFANSTKAVWNWVSDIENWKKLGASVANGFIALTKGLVHLVEYIGDAAIILIGAVGTLVTGATDLIAGLIKGDLDWSITKEWWKGVKSTVTEEWVNELYGELYNTEAGQVLDEYAYKPFKSDGIGCTVVDGIGTVVGIVLMTMATAGTATAATAATSGVSTAATATTATAATAGTAVATTSTATTMAAIAATSGFGKYTSEAWNENGITINYEGQELEIEIDYSTYREIEKLKKGESITINYNYVDENGSLASMPFTFTSLGNGEYDVSNEYGSNIQMGELNESSTVGGIAKGAVKGAWEGVQFYVGAEIGGASFGKLTNGITSPVVKTLAQSGIRVSLDTATAAVEVPFQSLVTMIFDDTSWDEAWKKNGGLDALKQQILIASVASAGGEAISFKGNYKKNQKEISKALSGVTDQSSHATASVHKKLIEMSDSEISNEIEKQIALLDVNDPNYTKTVDLLHYKEKLQLELKAKLSQTTVDSTSVVKTIDLLSEVDQLNIKQTAEEIYKRALSEEKAITEMMQDLTGTNSTLVGLEYNIKSLDSIEDKLARRIYEGYTIDGAKSQLNDSLRYTLVVDEGNYEQIVLSKLKKLQKQGYSIDYVNNSWGNSTYQGLNVTLKRPDGLMMELQFHTPSSFNTKQVINHELYEISRNASTSDEIRKLSNELQAINQDLYVGKKVTFGYYDAFSLEDVLNKMDNFEFKYNNAKKISMNIFDATAELKSIYGDAGSNVHNLLSQGKTVSEIMSILNDYEKISFQKFLDETIEGKYIASLTNEELLAINRYTGGDYSEINGWLRNGNMPAHEVDYINTLNSALEKYGGIKGDTQLFRGIDIKAFTGQEQYKNIFNGIDTNDLNQVYATLKAFTEGKMFSDAGYMSSSPSYLHSFAKYDNFPIVLDIIAEDGTKGAYINQMSQYYNAENEFLLAAGTNLKIMEVCKPEVINGQEKIVIKCIVDNG